MYAYIYLSLLGSPGDRATGMELGRRGGGLRRELHQLLRGERRLDLGRVRKGKEDIHIILYIYIYCMYHLICHRCEYHEAHMCTSMCVSTGR